MRLLQSCWEDLRCVSSSTVRVELSGVPLPHDFPPDSLREDVPDAEDVVPGIVAPETI